MTDTDTVINAARNLVLTCAPELCTRPLYVLEHPVRLPRVFETRAWTTHRMPAAIRDVLIERGEWQGPGTLIVLQTDIIRQDSAEIGMYGFESNLFQAALHEAAHNLPLHELEPDQEPNELQRIYQQSQFQRWSTEPIVSPELPPWRSDHGPRFIRVCLHLARRAYRQGYDLSLDGLCAGGDYALSHPYFYRQALGDETDRCEQMTFAEIQRMKPPKLFIAQWKADANHWNQQHQQKRAAA